MAPRVERKLAAILAVDVVGYSRLMEADEEGTHARLKALRKELIEPRIADHAGHIVKLTGDGALVEFPSVVEAVLAAVDIQRAVTEHQAGVPKAERIAFRIGVNLGDVIHDENDIYGDGVNVAARLQALAAPGGICVSRTVHNHVKNKLDVEFVPMGVHKIKNIAEPIEVWRVDLGAARVKRALRRLPARRLGPALAAAVVLVVTLGTGAWWYTSLTPAAKPAAGAAERTKTETSALPLPDKPSIAVLPFENLSGDPQQERLAGGLTEDVITDLSRFHELFVIARNSTEVYKGKPVDMRQVARELGVQYVLEGSLQLDGEQVRITAQLINGTNGNHVWAERYDRPLDDVFIVQDEVTKKIAGTLAPSMSGVLTQAGRESARRKPPENLQAYENYLLGIEHKHRFTHDDNQKALDLLSKAIELDPGFARAYVGLALAHGVAVENGWTASYPDSLDAMLKALRKAVALDPTDGQAHVTLAMYYSYVGGFEQGLAETEKALSLNPNDADVLVIAAAILPMFGRPEQAAELADRAVRINPNYPDWYKFNMMLAYFYGGQYDQALAATRSNLSTSIYDYVYRPLIYAQLGREADAATGSTELLQRDPEYSAERFLSDTGTFARDVELNRFLDSHRKAGLPLCAIEAQLAKYPDMKRLEQCEAERAKS
jgi:TolB-like protein/class 3 adenylate cyclase/tetratricopeptide (TPR) repeat protein